MNDIRKKLITSIWEKHNLMTQANHFFANQMPKPSTSTGIAMKNMQLFNEIILLSRLMKKAKIEYLLLKGPRLIRLYENAGQRETADIDVLVRKKDVKNIENILYSSGYKDYEAMHSKRYQELFGYHYQYKKKNLTIEVHFRLFPPLAPINNKQIDPWTHKTTFPLYNSRINTLDDDFLFIYIAINFMFPNFFSKSRKFLYELKLLSPNRDWNKILSIAIKSKSHTYVFLSCVYAKKIMNAKIPIPFIKKLEDRLSISELMLVMLFDEEYLAKNLKNTYLKKMYLYLLFNLFWRIRI